MTFSDLLDTMGTEPGDNDLTRGRPRHPTGWEPGLEMAGDTGSLTTPPMTARPKDWDELLAVWDLDPEVFEVVEPVQYRAWDGPVAGGGTQRMFYYRATVRRRLGLQMADVGDLVRRHRRRPRVRSSPDTEQAPAFGFAVGDLQLGEWNAHGGSEATVRRFYHLLEVALADYRHERKAGRVGGHVILPWLGDCVQGVLSQNGALVMRMDLTVTQAQQGIETMMADAAQAFSAVADRVQLVAIPGNHDETTRIAGKPATPFDDSWAVKAGWSVRQIAQRAGWDNVVVRTPELDTDVITLDVEGTVVAMAHGHQWAGSAAKGHDWLAQQSYGRTAAGDADVLLSAHRHHWYSETLGARTVVCVPAVCGDSAWWKRKTGQSTQSAALTFRAGGGKFFPAVIE